MNVKLTKETTRNAIDKYQNNNKDKIREYKHNYYLKNQERLRFERRQKYAANKQNKISESNN